MLAPQLAKLKADPPRYTYAVTGKEASPTVNLLQRHLETSSLLPLSRGENVQYKMWGMVGVNLTGMATCNTLSTWRKASRPFSRPLKGAILQIGTLSRIGAGSMNG